MVRLLWSVVGFAVAFAILSAYTIPVSPMTGGIVASVIIYLVYGETK